MKVLGPTSVEVTWQAPPPEHHNGAILSYIVRYFPSNDPGMSQDTHVTVVQNEVVQRKTVSNLKPFMRYTFKGSAVNAPEFGPFSMTVEGRTEEDGECMQFNSTLN